MQFIFDIKVVPGAQKQKCILDKSGILKCYLKSQAERNKANNELIKYIAKSLKIEQSRVLIISGEHSRRKKICIDLDISYEKMLLSLGISIQLELFKSE